jgi:serine protease Do
MQTLKLDCRETAPPASPALPHGRMGGARRVVAVAWLAMATLGAGGAKAALLQQVCLLDQAALRSAVIGPRSSKHSTQAAKGHAPGYLGIEFHELTDDQVATLHLSVHGVEVLMVDHDGPAGKAGLQPHDVIISLNGQPIASADALGRMIHDAGAGTPIVLTVQRRGRTLSVNAQLADRSQVAREAMARMAAPDPLPTPSADPEPIVNGFAESDGIDPPPPTRGQSFIDSMLHVAPFTGLALAAMEPQLAEFFGSPDGMGLLVETVAPDSPAAIAGLRAGDIVLRADTVRLHSMGDWTRHVHAGKGRPIALTILRDKHEMMLTLRPEYKHRSALELLPLGTACDVRCA